jgi:hypothetical protein
MLLTQWNATEVWLPHRQVQELSASFCQHVCFANTLGSTLGKLLRPTVSCVAQVGNAVME